MSPYRPDELPDGLTPSAREAKQAFEERLKLLFSEMQDVSLTVLIWGPSPDSEQGVAGKRRQARDSLRSMGHNALYSEEIPDLVGQDFYSQSAKEFLQVQAADYVVVFLEGSPGALAEVLDLASPEVRSRFLVLCPREYERSYAGQGPLFDLEYQGCGALHWYEPADLVQCNVMKAIVQRVTARRYMEYRRRSAL